MVHSTPQTYRVAVSQFGDGLVTHSSAENQQIASIENETFLLVMSGAVEQHRLLIKSLEAMQLSQKEICVRPPESEHATVLTLGSSDEAKMLLSSLKQIKQTRSRSVFDDRTEEASASQYFQFYGYLSQQQNMMQDYVRTYTYQHAMLSNTTDFQNKVVLDVGAGSGILSFFAVQSGARKVYAVEASSMAQHCQDLVQHNGVKDKITVICGKIEDITLPEDVDVIISEPMGYMLVNERMLETFLHARKFLKPNGKMFPTQGDLHIAPFSDEALYIEQCSKANFWCQGQFHGVNLSCLQSQALDEYLKQPVVDTFDVRICSAPSVSHKIDFQIAAEADLHVIDVPLSFKLHSSSLIHGLAFWFDCAFIGSNQTIWLSTAPTEQLTHWYQVRCMFRKPLLGHTGDTFTGRLLLKANKRQSYDVDISLMAPNGETSSNSLDLKNPFFRYTGVNVTAPPQNSETSPTENYWANLTTTVPYDQAAVQYDETGNVINTVTGQAMDPATYGGWYNGYIANMNAGCGGVGGNPNLSNGTPIPNNTLPINKIPAAIATNGTAATHTTNMYAVGCSSARQTEEHRPVNSDIMYNNAPRGNFVVPNQSCVSPSPCNVPAPTSPYETHKQDQPSFNRVAATACNNQNPEKITDTEMISVSPE